MNCYILYMPHCGLSMVKYTIKRQISSGSFGTIYETLNEEDNKIYALKELTAF